LNVIMAQPYENEYWRSFKVIIKHNEDIQAFEAILKHLEIEEECMKVDAPPNVTLIAKGNEPRSNMPYHS